MRSAKFPSRILLYALLPALLLLWLIDQTTSGHFTYTLDDPYIHLSLARHLADGHYGVNAHEYSSASSSILWPFLLAPFVVLGDGFQYAPLVINILCILLTALTVRKMLAAQSDAVALALILTVFLSLNVYGLAFTGMEHSLQVLLTAVIVMGLLVLHEQDGAQLAGTTRHLFAVSLVLLPLVRYEGLAITVPVIAYLICRGERRLALTVLALVCGLVGGFSLFLLHIGQGILPCSVMLKGSFRNADAFWANIGSNFYAYWFMWLPVGFLVWRFWRNDRALALTILATSVLQCLFGRWGWFGRYEVSYVLFVVLFAISQYFPSRPFPLAAWLLLPAVFIRLVTPTLQTPVAASNIYFQQGQMAEIVKRLDAPIAVNDLGMVSMTSPNYVFDLWGLANKEVLDARRSYSFDSAWMRVHLNEKNVRYVIVYDAWFGKHPDNWHRIARMKLNEELVTPFSDVVSFYAIGADAEHTLRTVLTDYDRQHPSDRLTFIFEP